MSKFKIGDKVVIKGGENIGIKGMIENINSEYHIISDKGNDYYILESLLRLEESNLEREGIEMNNEINTEEIIEQIKRLETSVVKNTQALYDQINFVKGRLMAIQNGEPYTESCNDEVLDKRDRRKSMTCLHRMIENLLKLKYCTIKCKPIMAGYEEIINIHRSKLFDITIYKSEKNRDINLIKYLVKNLDDIYDVGIEYYIDDARIYPYLEDELSKIPEECPWTLGELMEDSIDNLLGKIK